MLEISLKAPHYTVFNIITKLTEKLLIEVCFLAEMYFNL